MKRLTIFPLLFALSTPLAFAAFITTDSDVVKKLSLLPLRSLRTHQANRNAQILQVAEDELPIIGHYIHHNFNRCGGYIYHDSHPEAMRSLAQATQRSLPSLADYSINQPLLVESLIAQVDEFQIRSVIQELAAFQNRSYKTAAGVAAAHWLADHWRQLTAHRQDIKVELFNHKKWPQPSVLATIPGQTNEVIIVGGHLDSVQWLLAGVWSGDHAPGADDNASGIATLTEALRILAWKDYVPHKTIVFMGYAAEEVGLRGSKEIAQAYQAANTPIAGVMQLDMTNYPGSDTLINLINDYTNQEQNLFLGQLIDTYLKIPWGYTRCGYACSDHASWTAIGVPTSAPIEAQMSQTNRHIHSKHDTLEVSQGHAHHATHFARLVLAYIVELDR